MKLGMNVLPLDVTSFYTFQGKGKTEHHDMKAYWGNGGIGPSILNIGTRYR